MERGIRDLESHAIYLHASDATEVERMQSLAPIKAPRTA
jgi:hypothetical protein